MENDSYLRESMLSVQLQKTKEIAVVFFVEHVENTHAAQQGYRYQDG